MFQAAIIILFVVFLWGLQRHMARQPPFERSFGKVTSLIDGIALCPAPLHTDGSLPLHSTYGQVSEMVVPCHLICHYLSHTVDTVLGNVCFCFNASWCDWHHNHQYLYALVGDTLMWTSESANHSCIAGVHLQQSIYVLWTCVDSACQSNFVERCWIS